jgi:peptidoglycan/xylan/chitin deacetylase (PgdA/CDA1 family)
VTTRERIIYLAKASIARGLYTVGLLQLWQAVALRRKAVVLMYHRVLSDSERRRSASNPALIVGRETFAMHMRVLKRRFSVISVDELVDRMERRTPFRDSSCLITFDDGWCDNFTNALPSLREHGHPALVFLPINYIGTQRMFWQETLTHLLLAVVRSVERNPARKGRFAELLAPVGLEWVTELGGEDAHRAILPGVDEQKRTARHVVTELSAALVAELGFPLAEAAQADGFMTWDQVEAMSRDRVTFGGHGVEHLLLTTVPMEAVRAEIRDSRQALAARFDGQAAAFSYPNGYTNTAIEDEVRSAGYRVAFITRRGHVTSADDRFTIRRLNVHEAMTDTAPMFLARIVGLW